MSEKTLSDALKRGDCKITDNKLRGTNKGITKISKIFNAEKFEHIYLSNNNIKSLSGIENFTNLHVLSFAFNEIGSLNDLKYLQKLPLSTLNLEGNPITHLPYYKYHVAHLIPSIKLLDGHLITDKIRSQAQQIVSFEEEKLQQLGLYSYKIQQLFNLSSNPEANWNQAQNILLKTYDLSKFNNTDDFRNLAAKMKMEYQMKWSSIYDQIENNLQIQLSSLVLKFEPFFSKEINKAIGENQDNFNNEQEHLSSMHETSIFLNSRLEETKSIIEDSEKCQSKHLYLLAQIFKTYSLLKHSQKKLKLFYLWRLQCHNDKTHPIGKDDGKQSDGISENRTNFKKLEIKHNLTITKPLNMNFEKLIDHTQQQNQKIAELQTTLEGKIQSNTEMHIALNESLKNESKLQKLLDEANNQKNLLREELEICHNRYEIDLTNFMVKTKFQLELAQQKASELEHQLKLSQKENKILMNVKNEISSCSRNSPPEKLREDSQGSKMKKNRSKSVSSASTDFCSVSDGEDIIKIKCEKVRKKNFKKLFS